MTDSRTIYRNDFIERMAIGKQNATNRRNRGFGGGGPGTVKWKAGNYAKPEPHAHAVSTIVSAMRYATSSTIEDYLRAAFPERYEAFE